MSQYWKLCAIDSEQQKSYTKSAVVQHLQFRELIYGPYADIDTALFDPVILPLTSKQLQKWVRLTTQK